MRIYCCIIRYENGRQDVEFLDSEPTEEFRDSLWDGIHAFPSPIEYWEIREGYVNGGDSTVLFQSNG